MRKENSLDPTVFRRDNAYDPFVHLVHAIWGAWGENQKLMALFSGYFDDSGHETQDYLVCSGLVIDVERPGEFGIEWAKAIEPLTEWHTTDFVAGQGKFKEWRNRQAEQLRIVASAVDVIANQSFQTFSTALSLADYLEADSMYAISEYIGHPFGLCARYSVALANTWARRNHCDAPRIVIEDRKGKGEIVDIFERDGLPSPCFCGKSCKPLQAADLLAWYHYSLLTRSPQLQRFETAFKNLDRCRHEEHTLSKLHLLGICKNIADDPKVDTVERRGQLDRDIAFHHLPKKRRRRFKP